MRTDRTRSGADITSPMALVIAREIELLATRRGRLVVFDVEQIEAVGEHIAELVASARPRIGLIDARELAEELGVARDWVYANAERLGGVRLGDGPRARLRFDVELARGGTGGREQCPATEQRSPAAQARTAPTGGRGRWRASNSRQVRPVIADRAILGWSTYDGPAGLSGGPAAKTAEVGSHASSRTLHGLELMARPRRGNLKRRPTKQGISYGVAFTYRGEEFYEHFGGAWEGWDEERAVEEQRFLMEKVNRGERTPSKLRSGRALATAAPPTFQVEASHWLHRRKVRAGDLEGRTKTIRDLEWRLSVVMDKFGPALIDELDFGLADELVIELCEERAAIGRAAAEGAPLMRTVLDSRTGTSYQARRRGACAEVRGAKGRTAAPLVPRGRADRRGPARGRRDRGRASRADMGEGGSHPELQPFRGFARTRAWGL
jgi:hypothetical protein